MRKTTVISISTGASGKTIAHVDRISEHGAFMTRTSEEIESAEDVIKLICELYDIDYNYDVIKPVAKIYTCNHCRREYTTKPRGKVCPLCAGKVKAKHANS